MSALATLLSTTAAIPENMETKPLERREPNASFAYPTYSTFRTRLSAIPIWESEFKTVEEFRAAELWADLEEEERVDIERLLPGSSASKLKTRLDPFTFPRGDAECPYCSSVVTKTDLRAELPPRGRRNRFLVEGRSEMTGAECENCGWWMVGRTIDQGGFYPTDTLYEYAIGSLHKSHDELMTLPLEAVRSFLASHPDHLAHVNSSKFEQLMAHCLEEHHPGSVAHHVGGTGDGGTDILFVNAKDKPAVVQVKRRQRLDRPEGVSVVRELHGVMLREGFTRGMVISTAPRFTKGAYSEVSQTAKTLDRYDMKLLSIQDVTDLLCLPQHLDGPPWTIAGLKGPTSRDHLAWSRGEPKSEDDLLQIFFAS